MSKALYGKKTGSVSTMALPSSIEVGANIWRDSSGNSYHVAYVTLKGSEGVEELVSPVTYGYGTAYQQTAKEMLEEEYILVPSRATTTLRKAVEDEGRYKFKDLGADTVKRKKDL
jgi:hypothetical protein